MDSTAFLCPSCKVGLAPIPAQGMARCPKCGNYFSIRPVNAWDDGAASTFMSVLGRVIIFILALLGLLFSVAFAGCLFNFR